MTDVYLLGACLIRCLSTNKPPHDGGGKIRGLFAAGRNDIAEPDRTIAARIPRLLEYRHAGDEHAAARSFCQCRSFCQSGHRHAATAGRLAHRARLTLCQTGEVTGNYDFFSQAVYCAEEALAIWGGNSQALESIPAIQA